MQKPKWFSYLTVKNIWGYDYSCWQTDRQTPHDGIGRACIARAAKMAGKRCKRQTLIQVSSKLQV